ncbi:hypothetical protein AVEN_92475-1 [Araneus ventricosus]|uniref:Uncharacterized protein n=1 Tax=Araneus ventricosus TaxID=182803 RepID=A0A4Y2AJY0_ARAVE|nr:hypothetical protein AVEN_92475-1 [Araneus ventricosus]
MERHKSKERNRTKYRNAPSDNLPRPHIAGGPDPHMSDTSLLLHLHLVIDCFLPQRISRNFYQLSKEKVLERAQMLNKFLFLSPTTNIRQLGVQAGKKNGIFKSTSTRRSSYSSTCENISSPGHVRVFRKTDLKDVIQGNVVFGRIAIRLQWASIKMIHKFDAPFVWSAKVKRRR